MLASDLARSLARGAPRLAAIDLGTGTGSNVRYLAPRLAGSQDWLLVDEDEALLQALPVRMREWAATRGVATAISPGGVVLTGARFDCALTTRRANLVTLLDAPEAEELLAGRSLATASALLDLVSPAWVDRLLAACRSAGASVLFALTYDGRCSCAPSLPDDDLVRELVNAHQRTDKGFGPALGPDATAHVEIALRHHGYTVKRESSDWVIGPAEARLQVALIDGWADAASSIDSSLSARVARWRTLRTGHVESGRSTLVVGHQDLAGWLAPD